MSLSYDGAAPQKIMYDGVEVQKIYFDNVLVWESGLFPDGTIGFIIQNGMVTGIHEIPSSMTLIHPSGEPKSPVAFVIKEGQVKLIDANFNPIK